MKPITKINKLLTEYARKIAVKDGEIKMLLIDFSREYNKIWSESE